MSVSALPIQHSRQKPEKIGRVTDDIFALEQMYLKYEQDISTLWTYMIPEKIPNFNLGMLNDIIKIQKNVPNIYNVNNNDLKYIVLGSKFPNVFNLGGDLALFASLIESSDRAGLIHYANKCIEVFYNNSISLDEPIISIAMVQGDALGGGFEAALSFNIIVAERDAKFALPEIHFGLFPGMGAHARLIRLLGVAKAEKMIFSGKNYCAEELYDMGIVNVVADKGKGEIAVRDYIKQNMSRHHVHSQTYRASRQVDPITFDELDRIVKIWVETALRIDSLDLKKIQRLASAQERMTAHSHQRMAVNS